MRVFPSFGGKVSLSRHTRCRQSASRPIGADRKPAAGKVGIGAFLPQPEQGEVDGALEPEVAGPQRHADALAEESGFEEGSAGQPAARLRGGAVQPEGGRDAVAEGQIDLAFAQRLQDLALARLRLKARIRKKAL